MTHMAKPPYYSIKGPTLGYYYTLISDSRMESLVLMSVENVMLFAQME